MIEISLNVSGVAIGVLRVNGCRVGESPLELVHEVRQAMAAAVANAESPETTARKAAVRDMLRFGRYKPTGRGKPSSEYLLNAAMAGDFPFINSLVEVNNLVSLETMLPISIVDVARAGVRRYIVRRGRPGETYVFNRSGQVLDLADLLLLSREPGDLPCATPVKDSQATKTDETTTEVLGVVWAPASLAAEAREAARRMATLVTRYCGGDAEVTGLP